MALADLLGVDRDVAAEAVTLAVLLTLMTALAFLRLPTGERIDRFFGDLTYPLYMTHANAITLVLSTTVGYSFSGLIAGFALAIAMTPWSRAAPDPLVDRLRDAIRGRSLGRTAPALSMVPAREERAEILY